MATALKLEEIKTQGKKKNKKGGATKLDVTP